MKFGILTWSKVINHGAVLQAYSSQEVLKKLGIDSVILDYNSNKNGEEKKILNRVKIIIKRLSINSILVKLKVKKFTKEKADKFIDFRSNNLNTGKMYNINQNLDAVLIGSDMVFDFYEGYNPFMYGIGVEAPYIFSFSACFGYVTEKRLLDFENKDIVINAINKLNGVAYRDNNTGELIKKYCKNVNPVKTIDPVLLYGFKNEIQEWDTGVWKNRKYILIYSYTYNMEKKDDVKAIKEFAKRNGLEIISVGYIHRWCDESVNASPKEFVEMFSNASYVITDTFHGTIFSLIFNKQFCLLIKNNAFKVKDILLDLGLESRIKNNILEQLIALEEKPIDYIEVNEKIDELRQKSLNYLKEQISNVEMIEKYGSNK